MYKLWCEFDFGQEDVIFTSPKAAWKWLRAEIEANDMEDSISELQENGLAGIKELEVIS